MWSTTSIPREGYDRWQLGLRDVRLVTEPIVYEDLVDDAPSAAAQIVAKVSMTKTEVDSMQQAQL